MISVLIRRPKIGCIIKRDLKAAGGAEKMFSEQVSSVAQRARLTECLAFLREGDVLMVTKPDRLARSQPRNCWRSRPICPSAASAWWSWAWAASGWNTRNPTSKLILTILAGVATWEREIMLERQREGIAKAKAEGK
jgi:DNA invertase Pin-like site-specific DNA recombinase